MPLDDILSSIFGGLDFFDLMKAGWRYLFSPDYRRKKHKQWREDGWGWMLFEIVFGLLGFLISLGLLALLIFIGWVLLNS